MGIVYCEADRTFTIQTKNTTYQMQVDRFGFLLHLYYGKKTDGSCMDYLLTEDFQAIRMMPEVTEPIRWMHFLRSIRVTEPGITEVWL